MRVILVPYCYIFCAGNLSAILLHIAAYSVQVILVPVQVVLLHTLCLIAVYSVQVILVPNLSALLLLHILCR